MFSKKPVAASNFDDGPSDRPKPRPGSSQGQMKEKSFGEMESLGSKLAYASKSSAPARLNLSNALAQGKMRNPLEMIHKVSKWSGATHEPAVDENKAPGGARKQTPLDGEGRGNKTKKQDFPSCSPQRVELPAYLNIPPRVNCHELSESDRIALKKKIEDAEMLENACHRANKIREQGRALFTLGMLEDNLGNYSKSLYHYTAFLKVCKECSDLHGCALAFHCLGVAHQLLGTYPVIKPAALRRALYFHSKHREHSHSDGKFIAYINMGICYAQLGEKESSTVNHQYALRHALENNSTEQQTLALGNLGFSAGMYDDDAKKQTAIVQKYIQLTDERGAEPLEKLGSLAVKVGDFQSGKEYFEEALEVARKTHDTRLERSARVHLGIAAGETRFADHINNILDLKKADGFVLPVEALDEG